ncbi:MAG: NAD(P)(+) transhydrogenase (Re/Si-specific) subunit beta [Saprospiraceae bacterium]|nr:NAD(P)(+) transhydrogenase (Re/Si-specific) subunit beta [Saprospiraceae bacterium]MCF8249672.1 NAD(P)(+) transhydrogenase (Re/Si-specific) subunit beta [Saprospiraceae bacterium]MCF8279830.1 NAD(P)(+) transhydrogenase (Re/Si-specific) subunit beta [Bacteroidales bacterium]MCF8312341.1 NAD(P)(+) transhydrogenase (Re/Si-specific) subunit beta [Saprospiraceae bacterium]MCF8440662.1 NAD(P)(+) transhydrogenase (Re/Si-specific) subunit beta [Saprospiraceae bacterium]
MSSFLLELSYLFGSITFVIGLKKLSHPESARKGNLLAAAGMGLAILATILFHEHGGERIGNIGWIVAAMGIGTLIGWVMAMKVKMTGMPQMVSFFNGMGGACAAIISMVEYHSHPEGAAGYFLVVFLGLVIGSVSFSGSMIAYGKLDEKINDFSAKWLTVFNLLLLAVIIGILVVAVISPETFGPSVLWVLLVLSLLYGVLFVMPIGGADMPVVISLLNSLTGMAAAFGGFLYDNQIMLTGGILVGSAGTILTVLMCKAMNRSLLNVIIGSFGGGGGSSSAAAGDQTVKEVNLTDAAILCSYAGKVCIVPGYGLAVAQAQHICHDLEKQLEAKGVEVYYAIHPVAGRMPGHMNVLLAEADVPYPKLIEMEDANGMMNSTDVAIIVGANDVVNPSAENDPGSPIYGMPVIQVWEAKNVIVMKRSMRAGYAGIENPLFFHAKTKMLFGDAKDTLQKLVGEVKMT